MCGFFGIFSPNILNFDKIKLESLTNLLNHRGPDNTGYFTDRNISLGFKRLSIIDLKNANQPLESLNKRYVIVFNGEIYNYKDLRRHLVSKNIKLKYNSDTEVLLEGISHYGLDFIKKMNGMFAIALYDKKENSIFLFRDRLGIKPLFYHYDGNKIIFSSEIKPLIYSNLIKREINYNALSSYLSFRHNYGVGNYIKDIENVEPGEYLKISLTGITKYTYWEYPFENEKFSQSEKKILENCDDLLNEVTSEHMVSDVPVGSLLSGGLDSSLLTVLMSKHSDQQIKTFSASFDKSDYDENKYALTVANKINSKHTNIKLTYQEYENNLESIINHTQSPLSIPHEIALNTLFKEINSHSKVVISGEGADEMFGGYGRVQSAGFDFEKIELIKKYFPKILHKKMFNLFGSSEEFNWSRYTNQKDHFFDVYKWFNRDEKLGYFNKEIKEELNNDEVVNSFWTNEFEKQKGFNNKDKMIFLFQKFHLRCLLHRLDVHSMAHGVEARVPFCDHRIIEFMNRVPYNLKFKWKNTLNNLQGLFNNSFENSESKDISKYLLRKIGTKYLPNEIAYKKKLGFPVPLDHWLGGPFLKFAKEILLDHKTTSRFIFDKNKVEELLNNKENLNYDFWGKKIWLLLNVELWQRNVIDRKQ